MKRMINDGLEKVQGATINDVDVDVSMSMIG
jgi:hypothetical protein